MRTQRLVLGLGVLLAGLPAVAVAQVKEIPGQKTTVTATVEAVEVSTRSLTLRLRPAKISTVSPGSIFPNPLNFCSRLKW